MNTAVIKRHQYHLSAILLLMILLLLSITYPKGELELVFNGMHNRFLDMFFYYITETGTGYFYAIIAIAMLFYRYSIAFTLGLQGLMATIISNTLKHLIFTNSPRPPAFFSNHITLHFIEGSPIFYSNSFPSGHSITIFVLCTTLTYVMSRKFSAWLLCWALLVLLSRVYLLRHFILDVSVGGIIGLTISTLTTTLFYSYFTTKFGTSSLRITRERTSE